MASPLLESAYTKSNELPPLKGKALFEHFGKEIDEEKRVNSDLGKFPEAAGVAMFAATRGEEPVGKEQFIRNFIDGHPALANSPNRQMILGELEKSFDQETAWTKKNAWTFHAILDSARDPDAGGGAKATLVAMLTSLLKRSAPEDQRKILDRRRQP